MTPVTGPGPLARPARAGSWRAARLRSAAAVAALAAGAVTWAALPAGGAAPGLRPVLAVAVTCALFTAARLAAGPGAAARRQPASYEGSLTGFSRRVWGSALVLPWPQGLTVAALGLEALHPSRPWHTAVLGVVLLGFLLALHLAETGARRSVFRPHLPFLAAGLGLAALSAGAALLPAPGAGAGWLAVLAAVAAVIAAALSLPL
jgi:hypothetical protein